MSKITPKNLSYDGTLPPFLARLQANNSELDGRQDFHAARPKKARNADEDAEDEPVYFDENTRETLTKSEWEERDKFEGTGGVDKDAESGKGNGVVKEGKTNIASIGSGRKRKAARIVTGEDQEEDVKRDDIAASEAANDTKTEKVGKGKAAKKGKKVKLSFGDDD